MKVSMEKVWYCIFLLLEWNNLVASATIAPTRSPTTISPSSFLSIYNNIYLVAGASASATASSGTGGKATSAKFVGPLGIFQDSMGSLYVQDRSDNCVRSFNPTTDNLVKSVAGVCGSQGDQQNKPATSALLNGPTGLFGDSTGNVYIADYSNHKVKKVSGGVMTLFAGTGDTGQDGDGGQATAALMGYPNDVFIDTMGAMFVTLYLASTVRRIATSGIISLYAGVSGANTYTGDGGPATSAKMNAPTRSLADTTGLLYISDTANSRIRQVSPSGIMTLYAGTGSAAYQGENLAPTSANINNPVGIVVDSVVGDLYFSDSNQYRVYLVSESSGLMNTYAGSGVAGNTGNNGAATSATFNDNRLLVLDTNGNLYIQDFVNANVRVVYDAQPTVSPTVIPTTTSPTLVPSSPAPSSVRSALNNVNMYAGTGTASSTGNGGAATAATMNQPRSVWQDTAGVTYFSEQLGNCVRKIGTSGIVSAYAGVCTTTGSYGGDNAPATAAGMNNPVGLFVSTVGVAYIAEFNNNRVRAVSVSNIITTYAGSGSTTNSGNGGAATAGGIYQCHGLWVNSVGVMYVTSVNSHQVRSVSAGGTLSVFIGTGTGAYGGDGGQATSAQVNGPEKLFGDSTGVVYVADSSNHRFRSVSISGIISLLMGSGTTTWGSENVPATAANINYPDGMWKDSSNGDMYASARIGNRVVVLTATSGLVSTYAGTGTGTSTGDGGAATSATLNGPDGFYLTSGGVLLVAEVSGHKIRQIYSVSPTIAPSVVPSFSPSGPTQGPTTVQPSYSLVPTFVPTSTRSNLNNVYLYAGTGAVSSTGTGGPATSATMNLPRSVWQDTAGVTYFSEQTVNCVRKIGTSGIVSAFAGVCVSAGTFSGDNGPASSAGFYQAVGLFVSSVGVAYITDLSNNRVRSVSTSNIITTYAGSGSTTNSGDGGAATAGGINQCHGLWVNSVGVLYVTSLASSQVRSVSAGGILSLFAGTGTGAYSGDGGQATAAQVNQPEKLFGDSTGVVYIADSNNNRVRSVSTSGIISLVMGSGTTTWGLVTVPATSANIYFPDGMWKDSSNGDMYVSARTGNRVLVLTATTCLVSLFAGSGAATSTGDGGAATSATFNLPDGLYQTPGGVMLVVEVTGYKIRQIYSVSPTTSPSAIPSFAPSGPSYAPSIVPSVVPTGVRGTVNNVYLYAGTGTGSSTGNGGAATSATMNGPRSVWQDTAGVTYFSEQLGNCVRKISTNGILNFFAGVCSTTGSYAGDNFAASSAGMNQPVGLFVSTVGVAYMGEYNSHRVRSVSAGNIITTYAGTGSTTNSGNGGAATSGGINQACGVWVNSVGVLYVTSIGSNQLRSVSAGGILSLFAGLGTAAYSGDGGQATSAQINVPEKLFGDSTGVVYLADYSNSRVRAISTSGIISLVMGSGTTTWGSENVPATAANINGPDGLWKDSSNGDVYVSARAGSRVLVLTATTGLVSTYAGSGTATSTGDGGAATSATLNTPDGLYLTSGGLLFVVEINGYKIRQIYSVSPTAAPSFVPSFGPSGPTLGPTISPSMQPSYSLSPTVVPTSTRSSLNNVYLYAGTGTASSTGSGGAATSATMYEPRSVWQDTAGITYFSEQFTNCVRKIGTNGIVNVFAGVCSTTGSYSGDNFAASSAGVNHPVGLFVSTVGVTYFAESGNQIVRSVSASNIITTYAGSGSSTSSGNGGAATAGGIPLAGGLWVNSVGVLYVTSYGINQVRSVSAGGILNLFIGTGTAAYSGDGGQATAAQINGPEKLFGDSTGVVYLSDYGNNRVRAISTAGIISLVMGSGSTTWGSENVPATAANINGPDGLLRDGANGDVYVSGRVSNRVFVYTAASGLVSTFAGTGTASSTGDGGAATSATFNAPDGLYQTSGGILFVVELTGNKVRQIYSVSPTAAPSVVPSFAPSGPSYAPSLLPSTVPTGTRSVLNNVYLYAGTGGGGSSGTGGAATSATMLQPRSVWQDTAGVTYFSEQNGNCVRKIGISGIVSAYAAICNTATGTFSGDNFAATAAGMYGPVGLFVSTVGVSYIAEYGNNRVRSVSTSNIITTYAGTGSTTNSGNGGAATSGGINQACGLWVSSIGVMYVTSLGSYQVRSVSAGGILSLFAGIGSSAYSGDGGQATAAQIVGAEKLFGDSAGVVYVADTNGHRVRSVSISGIISLLMGSGTTVWGSENVPATSANINTPDGLWKDSSNGDVYVSARVGNRVLVLTASSGLVSTFAGTGTAGSTGDGGAATSATLNAPDGLYRSSGGVMFVVELTGYKIRQIYSVSPTAAPTCSPSFAPSGPSPNPTFAPTALPTTTAPSAIPTTARGAQNNVFLAVGTGASSSTGNGGKATSATTYTPRGIWQDTAQNIYFAENDGHCIRKYSTLTNLVSAVGGTCGTPGYSGDNGPATSATFKSPVAMQVDTTSVVYWADLDNYRVRKISTAGIVTLYAGTGNSGNTGDNGQATAANLNRPCGLSLNSAGLMYITVYDSHIVKSISTSGILTWLAGTGSSGFSGDGGQATSAALYRPERIMVSTTGLIYISDSNNDRVRTLNAANIINTVLGSGVTGYSGEGQAATSSALNYPTGTGLDTSNGDLYVAPRTTCRIQVMTGSSGLVTTYAGTGTSGSSGDGGAATSAKLVGDGMFLDTTGRLYFGDYGNNKVRVIYSVSPTSSPTVVPTLTPSVGPSLIPTLSPSVNPSLAPTVLPTVVPSLAPSTLPTVAPSGAPSVLPTTLQPSIAPSLCPTLNPTTVPTTTSPSVVPTLMPSSVRSTQNFIYQLAGTGTMSSTGTGGLATAATLSEPRSVWQDSTGILYWVEGSGRCARKMSLVDNIVQNYAGTCGVSGTSVTTGAATSGVFGYPCSIVGSTGGAVYVSDYSTNQVRAVSNVGIMSLYGGTGDASDYGDSGSATSAGLNHPFGNWVNSVGTLYVAMSAGSRLRAISASGIITTIAGTGTNSFSGDGGAATSATLAIERLWGLSTGTVYMSDPSFYRVRQVSFTGIISTFAGTGSNVYNGENQAATSTSFVLASGIAVDTGNYDTYICDREGRRIRVVTGTTGLVSTFAGTGVAGNTGNNGAATSCTISPETLFLDTNSKVYVSDYYTNVIRTVLSVVPTTVPSIAPTNAPTVKPTGAPTQSPTAMPTVVPTILPSMNPTAAPTVLPTISPTVLPSVAPSIPPSVLPTVGPTSLPSVVPSVLPTVSPSTLPTQCPTVKPSEAPTQAPSVLPTVKPSLAVLPVSASPSFKVVNAFAFAGITSTGGVLTWGSACCGGDSSSVSTLVKTQVKQVVQSKNAFAALKTDGSVVAWGSGDDIAGSTEFRSYTTIVSLVATERAFAGVTSGGGVIAFGADCCGGNVDQYGWAQYLTSDVSSVRASAGAFCALKTDGTVYCWGSKFAGGGVSSLTRSDLKNIVFLTSTRSAFAAMTSDGSVVVWGNSAFGGSMSSVIETKLNQNTQYIVSGGLAFVASTSSGGLVAWGSASDGGDSSSVVGVFNFVAHSASAFAGVRSNGTLTSWGNSRQGGDSSSVAASLSSVSVVVGNTGAFAAITTAGTVIAWGESESGGRLFANVSSTIGSGVTTIYHASKAFAVLSSAGAVTAWGKHNMGGSIDSSIATALSSEVKLICANDNGFTAIKMDGTAYGWSHSAGVLSGDYSLVSVC